MRSLNSARRWLRRILQETAGTAAIEFSIIIPVFAIAAVTLSDASSIATGASKMQTAVRASIQYAMNGGTDMSAAKTQGINTWVDKPSGATMTVSEQCVCGGGAGTCGTLCADGSVPSTYVTAVAQATLGGDVIKISKNVTESVRVQ